MAKMYRFIGGKHEGQRQQLRPILPFPAVYKRASLSKLSHTQILVPHSNAQHVFSPVKRDTSHNIPSQAITCDKSLGP